MTDEERLAKMRAMAPAWNAPPQRSCKQCRWSTKSPGMLCRNPVIRAANSGFPELLPRRSPGMFPPPSHVYCGPNGLLWERRWWWPLVRLYEWIFHR